MGETRCLTKWLGLAFIILGIGIESLSVRETYRVISIARNGKAALATITAYKPKQHSTRYGISTSHFHVIEYNGYHAELLLHHDFPTGTKIEIFYLPNQPAEFCQGRKEDSFSTLLKKNWKIDGIAGAFGFPLCFILMGVTVFFIDRQKPTQKSKTSNPKKSSSPDSIAEDKEALESIERALIKTPQDLELWMKKGIRHQNLQHMELAHQAFERAISLNPESADAWYLKGSLLAETNDFIHAHECYSKACQLEPNFDEPPPISEQMSYVETKAIEQKKKLKLKRSKRCR